MQHSRNKDSQEVCESQLQGWTLENRELSDLELTSYVGGKGNPTQNIQAGPGDPAYYPNGGDHGVYGGISEGTPHGGYSHRK